jgi:hypothetical protein
MTLRFSSRANFTAACILSKRLSGHFEEIWPPVEEKVAFTGRRSKFIESKLQPGVEAFIPQFRLPAHMFGRQRIEPIMVTVIFFAEAD